MSLEKDNSNLDELAVFSGDLDSATILRAVMTNAPIGLAVLDTRLHFVRANQALAEMNGLSVAEHEGRHIKDVLPSFPQELIELCHNILQTGVSAFAIEVSGVVRGKPDSLRYFLASYYPIKKQATGPVVGVGVVLLDITERKNNEKAQEFLAQAATTFASSLDTSTILQNLANLLVPDLADGCYSLVSDTLAEDQLAVIPAAFVPTALKHRDPAQEQILRELVESFQSEQYRQSGILDVLRTGEPFFRPKITVEMQQAFGRTSAYAAKFNELNIGSYLCVPLVARDRAFGAFALLRTRDTLPFEPHHFELALEIGRRVALALDNARLYQQAKEAVVARDEFLSVAAHELKTPITSLKGFAQILLRRLTKDGYIEQERLSQTLDTIARQSERLNQLVQQLLDVSRIKSGKLVLHYEPTALAELVQEVIKNIKTTTNKHNFVLELKDAQTPLIETDPVRLEQVLINLLDNAVKYSPDGGDVRVEIKTKEPTLQISVTDQGRGIAPQHRPYIFERFYQGHRTGEQTGMGLGLHISRQIIEQHGGTIWVEFPANGGSRFIIELPYNQHNQQK